MPLHREDGHETIVAEAQSCDNQAWPNHPVLKPLVLVVHEECQGPKEARHQQVLMLVISAGLAPNSRIQQFTVFRRTLIKGQERNSGSGHGMFLAMPDL